MAGARCDVLLKTRREMNAGAAALDDSERSGRARRSTAFNPPDVAPLGDSCQTCCAPKTPIAVWGFSSDLVTTALGGRVGAEVRLPKRTRTWALTVPDLLPEAP